MTMEVSTNEVVITAQMIADHPVGADTLPNGESVPLNCVRQLESFRKWKEREKSENGRDPVPMPGGYGTWNPIKSECTGCPGSLQCYAKTYRVPMQEIEASLEKATGLKQGSVKRPDDQ